MVILGLEAVQKLEGVPLSSDLVQRKIIDMVMDVRRKESFRTGKEIDILCHSA